MEGEEREGRGGERRGGERGAPVDPSVDEKGPIDSRWHLVTRGRMRKEEGTYPLPLRATGDPDQFQPSAPRLLQVAADPDLGLGRAGTIHRHAG